MGMAKVGSRDAFISSKQDSITVKLEYTGIPIFNKSVKPVPLAALHSQCVQQLKKFEGRKLNEQEKAAKMELSEIKAREEAEQEREETERVIDALGSGFEVTLR
jgi:mitochondrial fission protein ELM1